LPQGDKKILRPYVSWHTTPRLRTKAIQVRMTVHIGANTRTHLRGLAHFLAYLPRHHNSMPPGSRPSRHISSDSQRRSVISRSSSAGPATGECG
jgi:hypothetical protein